MPPSINDYWGEKVVWVAKQKRHMAMPYVTHEGKEYQSHIRGLMLERRAWYHTANPVSLQILCCFQDERGNDLDNRVKVLQDALKFAYVYMDDKQVKRLEVREGSRMKPPVVFVRLTEFLPDRNANLAWIQQAEPSLHPKSPPQPQSHRP